MLAVILGQPWNALNAQDYRNQVALQHDNDLYLLIDQYYTAGTALRYDHLLTVDTIQASQIHFQLSQELYTPYLSTPVDTSLYDRPFAGVLRLQSGYQVVKPHTAWLFALDYAMIGSQTKAGDVHKFYHRVIGEQTPAWKNELPNKHHINASGEHWVEYDTDFPLIKKMRWENKVALGTLDTYLQTGFNLDFTRLVPLHKSLVSGSLMTDEQFNINTGLYYRYQFFDSSIEGHAVNQEAIFTKSIVHHLLMWRWSAIYQFNDFRFKMTYHHISKKNINMRKHEYLSIKIGFLF